MASEDKKHKFIPYGRQYIDQEDIDAVVEVLKSDFITTGPKVGEFEEKLAKRVGAKYAVAVSNGTAALHAACYAAGIGVGDEVITTPMTFAASANSVLYMGAKVVFADIDPVTYNIDPNDIRKKITSRTKAIIPIHFTGQPCNMKEIIQIASEHKLTIIEDAAHALGAEYMGQKVGSICDMTTFSFHPVKHITTGEGGAITTNSIELFQKLLMFRTHGITKDKNCLFHYDEHGPWYYEQQFLGYNYRLTDIQAALGSSQLNKLDTFIEKRTTYAKMYNEAFEKIEGLIIPSQMQETTSAWHLYIIQLELEKLKADRAQVFNEMLSRNIGVNVHYIPVYYHPYYQSIGYEKGLCPNAEALYERMITLPLYPGMDEEDVQYVINNLIEIVDKYRV